jgi:hypothetical protein
MNPCSRGFVSYFYAQEKLHLLSITDPWLRENHLKLAVAAVQEPLPYVFLVLLSFLIVRHVMISVP